MLGDQQSAQSNKKYNAASKVALFNATEWSTVLSTLKFGNEGMSPAQISILTDRTNDYLRGLATNGTGTATRTLPVLSPGTAANIYSLIYWLDEPGMVEIQGNTALTFYTLVMTKAAKLADVQVSN
jgi:hypothetical protein